MRINEDLGRILIETVHSVGLEKEIAILCRTNSNVAFAYKVLQNVDIPCFRCDRSVKMNSAKFRFQVSALRLLYNKYNDMACRWIYQYYYPNDMLLLKKCELHAMEMDKSLVEVLAENIDWFKYFLNNENFKYAYDAVNVFLKELPLKNGGIIDDYETGLESMVEENPHIPLGDFLANMSLRSVQDELFSAQTKEYRIKIMTVHASKGLEFDNVIIFNAVQGTFPLLRKNSDYEEERRIFYVAMTRAIERLFILTVSDRESQYLREIMKED